MIDDEAEKKMHDLQETSTVGGVISTLLTECLSQVAKKSQVRYTITAQHSANISVHQQSLATLTKNLNYFLINPAEYFYCDYQYPRAPSPLLSLCNVLVTASRKSTLLRISKSMQGLLDAASTYAEQVLTDFPLLFQASFRILTQVRTHGESNRNLASASHSAIPTSATTVSNVRHLLERLRRQ